MISEDKFNLRPIWDATLEIYQAVVTICERHNLRHYVTDGTLIGAIRHKGFVPWDDDFDMSMPRPDYEKFIEYAKTELPPHLKFVNWHNTPEFHGLFGKVQDCRREVVEGLERKTGRMLSNGLFIDIFPIEGYPESKLGVWSIKARDFLLTQLMVWRFGSFRDRSLKGKLMTPFGFLLACLMPWLRTHSDFMRVYEKMLLKHRFEKCRFTGRASLRLHVVNRPPLPVTAWGNGQTHEFHDRRVMVPSDYDAYLRPIYGDYMKMPPEEKRRPTHDYGVHCPWWLGPTNDCC